MITQSAVNDAVWQVIRSSSEEFDENTVTPGVFGFIAIFLIAAVTVLLAIDMTRRVRRTRYRGEISEQLDAEEAERQAADIAPSTDAPGTEAGTAADGTATRVSPADGVSPGTEKSPDDDRPGETITPR